MRRRLFKEHRHTLERRGRFQGQPGTFDIEKTRKEDEGRTKLMAGLLGGAEADERLKKAVLIFCKRAMQRRNKLVRTVLDQMT